MTVDCASDLEGTRGAPIVVSWELVPDCYQHRFRAKAFQ